MEKAKKYHDRMQDRMKQKKYRTKMSSLSCNLYLHGQRNTRAIYILKIIMTYTQNVGITRIPHYLGI